jgi:hypothetical protein
MGFIKIDIKDVVLPLLLTGMLQNVFAMDLPKGCWIPEGYVEYLSSSLDQRDVKSWLMPFANIIIQEEMIAVKAYGSESATVVRFRSEGSRAELLHIERIINEKYFDPKAVRETRFYLSQDSSFLVLTIERQGTQRHVRFVNELKGFAFTTYYDAIFRIKIAKDFSIIGSNQTVSFAIDGWITNFPKWLRFELIRDYPYVANDLVVTLVKIIGIDTRKEYAIYISGDKVDFYEYEWLKHEVMLSPEPAYSLQVSMK